MNERIKEKRGITLIALVITIIVLIILAAVTVGVLTGENGLISRSYKSGNITKIESVQEIARLAYTESIIDQHAGGTLNPIQNVLFRIEEQGYQIRTIDSSGQAVGERITGIDLIDNTINPAENLSGQTITLQENGNIKSITVALQKEFNTGEDTQHYVYIDGKWYRLIIESGNVIVEKNGVDNPGETEQSTQSCTVTITVPAGLASYVKVNNVPLGETRIANVILTIGETESAVITIDPTTETDISENVVGELQFDVTGQPGWSKIVNVEIRKRIIVDLFNNGVINDIAGDFVLGRCSYNIKYSTGTFSKNTILSFNRNNSSGQWNDGGMFTQKAIDVTNFNTITFYFSSSYINSSNSSSYPQKSYLYLGLVDKDENLNSLTYTPVQYSRTLVTEGTVNSRLNLESSYDVDIKDAEGEYYIGFLTKNGYWQGQQWAINITRIVLH